MVQCSKCGMQNVDGGKFCRFCGVALMQASGGDTRKPYSWQSEELHINSDQTQNYQGKQTQVFTPPPTSQQTRPISQHQQPHQPHQPRTLHQSYAPHQHQHPQHPQQVQPLPMYSQTHPQHLAYGHNFCNNCRMQVIPFFQRKISQAGWIVFAVLLVSVPPLFWIGLCIREDALMCPVCKTRIR